MACYHHSQVLLTPWNTSRGRPNHHSHHSPHRRGHHHSHSDSRHIRHHSSWVPEGIHLRSCGDLSSSSSASLRRLVTPHPPHGSSGALYSESAVWGGEGGEGGIGVGRTTGGMRVYGDERKIKMLTKVVKEIWKSSPSHFATSASWSQRCKWTYSVVLSIILNVIPELTLSRCSTVKQTLISKQHGPCNNWIYSQVAGRTYQKHLFRCIPVSFSPLI